MAESYISELGDSLSHGVANTNGDRVKIIAPKLYNDGNGNHPSIATALSGKSPTSHTHGNIANGGTLTDTAAAAAGNDYVVIRDADNSKIQTSTIKGTDVADAVSKKHSHSTLTLSTTAQAYDGSHTLALPSTDPYTSARTPASHMHGNIQNGGTLQTNDITIANGDKLVVTDSSDSSKVARASISFDGSTTTSMLSHKGTWSDTIAKANYPTGFADRLTSWSWGTLTTGNGYTQLSSWKTSGGGQMAFAKNTESGSDDALSVQIDGTFYQHEGKHKVLDAADVSVPSTVPTLAWNTESTLATIDGKNIKVKLPASPDTDTKVTQTADDASTGTGFELLFSATGDNTTRTETSRKSSKLTYQPSTGTIKSTAYNVNSKCTLQFNTTTNALDFVFA